jgi:hypothetical protein
MFDSKHAHPSTEDTGVHAAAPLRIASRLAEMEAIDPLYRDLYLWRALTVVGGLLPEAEYERMRARTTAVDDLLRQARRAVEHGEWERVKELADRIRTSRRLVDESRPLMDLGAKLYGSDAVPIDPFSPDLAEFVSIPDAESARKAAVAHLVTLGKDDAGWRSFYDDRRAHFDAPPRRGPRPTTAAASPLGGHQVEREALQAIQSGNVDLLERLARQAIETRAARPSASRDRPALLAEDLSAEFSEETVRRAEQLGLRLAHAAASQEVSDYLACCCAWRPMTPDRPLTETTRRAQGCTCGHVCPATVSGPLQDAMNLLIVHPFITSAGARYLPRFRTEDVLVEEFPEDGGDEPSPLLLALGLKRRRAVSRREIERALLRTGPDIVGGLGLDPVRFRIVCIPFDLYSRLGQERGWGRREQWTHFDGYQIWTAGKLRALVGGDVRFGGLNEFCSIAVDDERDNVMARFALVRRGRLA